MEVEPVVSSSLVCSPELGLSLLCFQPRNPPTSHIDLRLHFVSLFMLSCHHGNTPHLLGLWPVVIWALSSRWVNRSSKYLRVRKSQVARADKGPVFWDYSHQFLWVQISHFYCQPSGQSLISWFGTTQGIYSPSTTDTSFSTQTLLYFSSLFFFLTCSLESLFFLFCKSFKVSEFLLGKTTLFIPGYPSRHWHIYMQWSISVDSGGLSPRWGQG